MQVVAGAGAIDHSHLVDLAGKSFANLPTDPTTANDLVKKVTSLHGQNHCTAGGCAGVAGHVCMVACSATVASTRSSSYLPCAPDSCLYLLLASDAWKPSYIKHEYHSPGNC